MVTYLALVLSSIVLWHGETHGADDGCSHTYLVHNNSEADVQVWIERKVQYERKNKTTFEAGGAQSQRTYIGAGKSVEVKCYRPEYFFKNNLSEQESSVQSGFDLS